jgi:glycerophosphoryl diester phosphodiesterase
VPTSFGEIEVVNQVFVDAAHNHGLAVHVWTINETPEMERLLDLGVDGIITDTPSPLVQLLTQRGVAWDGRL